MANLICYLLFVEIKLVKFLTPTIISPIYRIGRVITSQYYLISISTVDRYIISPQQKEIKKLLNIEKDIRDLQP